MTSARLLQCARPLLVVVPLLLLCCCRPADAQLPDLTNFTCAKTGAKLPGGLTILMDNQIRMDAGKRDKDHHKLHVLLLNTTDEKPTMTVVAGPPCPSVFSPGSRNSSKCDVGKANTVSPKHGPCPDAGGCKDFKEFSFNCPMAQDPNLPASVFQINLKDFQSIDEQCKGRAYIYIDNVRLLLDGPMAVTGEKCPAEGPKKPTNGSTEATTTSSSTTTTTSSSTTTTTKSPTTTTTERPKMTTTGSTEATTTNSANATTTNNSDTTTTTSSDTMTTGSTETMGSTDTPNFMNGTMIYVLAGVGAGLLIAVVVAVVFVLCRRKGTSADDAAPELVQVEEPEEKSAAEEEPPADPKTEGVEVPDSAYSKGSQDEDGSTAANDSTVA